MANQPPRVRLRKLDEDDARAVYRLLSDMQVIRYMLFPVFNEQDAQDFVRQAGAGDGGAAGQQVVRAIAFADNRTLMGLCGLVVDRDGIQAEAWYLLDPDYWGKGLATEALRQLLAIGFGELRLHRIWASCLPANPASARVLKKAGMRREGYLRKNLRVHGEWRDCFLYAILHEEWRR